jgi:hypothetical protein
MRYFHCPNFMIDTTPHDSAAANPDEIDGYITLDSLCRLAAFAQHCRATAVIGSGYGETVATFQLAQKPGYNEVTSFMLEIAASDDTQNFPSE